MAGTYTVRSGDCLSMIAQRAGVSLQALEAANPQFSSNWNLIHPGDRVVIPGKGYIGGDSVTRRPIGAYGAYGAGGTQRRVGGTPTSLGALTWAEDQWHHPTARNPDNGQTGPAAWDDYCLGFVSTAFGGKVPELRADSAIHAYDNFHREGKIRTDWKNMPAGSPVFFGTYPGNPYGHIAIFTGKFAPNGDPIVLSTGWSSRFGANGSGMQERPISYFKDPLGYAVV